MGKSRAVGRPGPARKHHHVPVFYLRPWVDPETGQLWETWRTRAGDLKQRATGPKGTGYERDLYSFRSDLKAVDLPAPDALETSFFGPLDNAAAVSRDRLLSINPS